jgi:hypothetical protein
MIPYIDKTIERGVIFLLIFTPLAFGSVPQWSVAVLEITAFALFFLLLLKKTLDPEPDPDPDPGAYALEIAWRVYQDPEVVKGIAPDTPDAAQVVQLFMEGRGNTHCSLLSFSHCYSPGRGD